MRRPFPGSPVWLNGGWVPAEHAGVRLDDPGLLGGLGVYETLGVRDRRCLELDEHLERMAGAAEFLGVPLPERASFAGAAERIAREGAGAFGWVKLVATRGGDCAVFGGALDPAAEGRPAAAILLPWRRNPLDPLCGFKTLNCGALTMGHERARSAGVDEGLWLNTRGHLAEGCASSLFVVHHRIVYTPSLRDGILPGVTRALVLDAARRLGLQAHVGKVRLKRLERAHEAFLTSSVLGVRPLVALDGHPVGSGEPGPITVALAAEVRRRRSQPGLRAVPVVPES